MNYSEAQTLGKLKELGQNDSNELETQTEKLISICEKIKNEIKAVMKAIIFKDIKLKLKETIFDITRINKILGHGGLLNIIENNIKDLEDREFISQNYRDPSIQISPENEIERSITFLNFLELTSNVLLPDYGMKELSGVLESIGKNWNFDI